MDPPRHNATCVDARHSGDNKECGLHSWHISESGNTLYDTIPTWVSYQVFYIIHILLNTLSKTYKRICGVKISILKKIFRGVKLLRSNVCIEFCYIKILHILHSLFWKQVLITCFPLPLMQGIFQTPVAVSAQLTHSCRDSCLGKSCPPCKGM